MFLNSRGENVGSFSDDALKNFAAALGLNQEEFDSCLDSDQMRSEVDAEQREGQEQGVESTPTLVINGQLFRGAVPFEQLQSIIDSELASS